jgi:hypothetical protein
LAVLLVDSKADGWVGRLDMLEVVEMDALWAAY